MARRYDSSSIYHNLRRIRGIRKICASACSSTWKNQRSLFHLSSTYLSKSAFSHKSSVNDNDSHQARQEYQKAQKSCKTRISFITDIEGDAAYFDRFINASKVLAFESLSTNNLHNSNDANTYYCGLDYFPYDKHVVFQDENDDHTKNDTTTMLVCGGDMWDKGGNDLYVTRQLLSLQRRYGKDRVHFILGNRDINKMRILQELGEVGGLQQQAEHDEDNDNHKGIPHHGGVYWLKGSGLMGDPEAIAEVSDPATSVPDDAIQRLKWMLRKTMGSPNAFELRRQELASEKKHRLSFSPSVDEEENDIVVTDEEVVQSYRSSCHPVHGVMGQYIQNGKLAWLNGGVLFLHGALPIESDILSRYKECILEPKNNETTESSEKRRKSFWLEFYASSMPWLEDNDKMEGENHNCSFHPPVETASEWVNSLNAFAQQNSQAWANCFTASSSDDTRPMNESTLWSTTGGYGLTSTLNNANKAFGPLMQYGMGWLPINRAKNPTVVYNSWFTDGMPRRFYGKEDLDKAYATLVAEFFEDNKLDLMVTGHQPIGDTVFPIQVLGTNDFHNVGEDDENTTKPKFIISGDTSYSSDTKWIADDDNQRTNLGRGKALGFRGDAAVTEIIIDQCIAGEVIGVHYHGQMSDGSSYESINLLDGSDEDASLVGKLVDRNRFIFEGSIQDDSNDQLDWFVKAKFIDGSYLVSSAKGYDFFNSIAKIRRK